MALGFKLRQFHVWRLKNVNQKTFIRILSVVIGLAAGLSTVIIKNIVHLIQHGFTSEIVPNFGSYMYLLSPFIGLILTMLFIIYVVRVDIKHGIPNVLFSLSSRKGRMKKHNMYSSIIGSALTVGLGGSVGLEGPAVATSSAIGANIAQIFKLNYKSRALLIGCAAAGSLSAIFNAPITSIVFALEVIVVDLSLSSLIPLLLATSVSTITSRLYLGSDSLFRVAVNSDMIPKDVLFYIFLGVFTGLFAVYFQLAFFSADKLFNRIPSRLLRGTIGGAILGLLIFLFPALYGEGYGFINTLTNGAPITIYNELFSNYLPDNMWIVFLFLFLLVTFKAIATSVTLGCGGVGGIFAPTLFMGSTLGYLFGKIVHYLGLSKISESNFTLVGMAGMMAGVLHAPLTAIFLIAEITGGYDLFIPLMIASAVSFSTTMLFTKQSVYTKELALRGELLTHDKDQAVLTLMSLSNVIEKDFTLIKIDQTLGDLVQIIADSKRNLFPVINEKKELIGIVTLNDIRHTMFDKDKYDLKIEHFMHTPTEFIQEDENMKDVMKKFESSHAWNLPVIYEHKYVGFVSQSKLFNAYRTQLSDLTNNEEPSRKKKK